ncbi:MAG: hypothetical protein QQN55_08480 [Nitrosopumilus sp.]
MTFKKWFEKHLQVPSCVVNYNSEDSMVKCWNASKKDKREECAKIARNHPVFFKNGNIKSADVVRGEIAIAIEKSREI